MSNIDDIIRERLDRLRNEDPGSAAPALSSIPTSSKRSAVEEVEFLLQRLSHETELDEKACAERGDLDAMIRLRLDKLKAESARLGIPSSVEAKKIIGNSSSNNEPVRMEVNQNAEVNSDLDDDDDSSCSSLSSLDQCIVCDSSRPTLCCKNCAGDIFCSTSCFNSYHDKEENHKPISYPFKSKVKF